VFGRLDGLFFHGEILARRFPSPRATADSKKRFRQQERA
jgi:hypothetical protein